MNKKLTVILSYAVLLCAFACQKNTDIVRNEYIRFYSDKNLSKEINVLQIPFEGESAKVIIKTNADVVVKFEPQIDEGQDSWITFEEPVKVSDGTYEVSYIASGLLKDLDQRTASVNVTAQKIWLGKFLKVCQGYKRLWGPGKASAPKKITYGNAWKSASVTGIDEYSHAYVSFNAYATAPNALDPKQTFQLEVALSEGALFEDNGLQTYVVDIVQATDFAWSNLVALPFKAKSGAFKSDTNMSLSLLSDMEGLVVSIDSLKVYNVTDDLREDGDGEEWGEGDGEEMGDIE